MLVVNVSLPDRGAGGDSSRFRRPRQKQQPTPSLSRAEMEHEPPNRQNRDPIEGDEDPIYAELDNPGDALQILARLAASDTRIPNNLTNSAAQDSFTGARSSDGARTVTAAAGNGPINSIQPPLLQSILSETETLMIGVLGTDTVNGLVQQYKPSFRTNVLHLTHLLTRQTTTLSALSRPKRSWQQQIHANQQ